MSRSITYSFGDNFLDNIADFIYRDFFKKYHNLDRIACVFSGKRPGLFLKAKLAERIKASYIPPRIFSIDEFMQYVIAKDKPLANIRDLDASYLIYNLAKDLSQDILKGREEFKQFIPWAREIIAFIEQLDLEAIENKSLLSVEESAKIGYEVPESINLLLAKISKIRDEYHKHLLKVNQYSRGLIYLKAAQAVNRKKFSEFEVILFCNFYYLPNTQAKVMKDIYDKNKAICFFQGNQEDWPQLSKNAKLFNSQIKPQEEIRNNYKLNLYEGFDMHSQVCLAREIIKDINDKKDTVVVLPLAQTVIPLLSEISSYVKDFNVSMGYPINRSLFYALFNSFFKLVQSQKGQLYYSKDYLSLLKHPLIKSINFIKDPAFTRVLIHKLEELLQGQEDSSIGGSLFIDLETIAREDKLYSLTKETLEAMNIEVKLDDCRELLNLLHDNLFIRWAKIDSFDKFSKELIRFLDLLREKSFVSKYPFNVKVIEILYELSQELQEVSFSNEKFALEDIWEIFINKLDQQHLSFLGSPLRGMQILGVLETRALNFKNVIVLDVNESVLPKLKDYEPLIPREVMLSLGLNRLEEEEEIQRYQFMRLINQAKNVHLIYKQDEQTPKSRFIEELLWQQQQETKRLEALTIKRANFTATIAKKEEVINKTPEMIEYLKKSVYSASRLDVYLHCPLKFYYQYVLGLKEKDDLLEGPQERQVGTFIHELLETCFKPFLGKKPIIDEQFINDFFMTMQDKFERQITPRMRSDAFLLKGIIKARLEKFLKAERERELLKILAIEERNCGTIYIDSEPVLFTYTVDRLDQINHDELMIIDYKTGGSDISVRKLKDLSAMDFNRQEIKDKLRSFQLPLYYYFFKQRMPEFKINAQLYNLRNLTQKFFISQEDLTQADKVLDISMQALHCILKEIFNLAIPFTAQREEQYCNHCPFRHLGLLC